MLRILRSPGVLVFTVRPVYWEREVEEDIGALVARGAVDVLSLESAPYMLAQRATAWYTCLRRRARGR